LGFLIETIVESETLVIAFLGSCLTGRFLFGWQVRWAVVLKDPTIRFRCARL
jgi:hypothetical protein